MEHINGRLQPDSVDGSVGAGTVVRYNLQHAGAAESLKHLGIDIFLA
jgi:hypothetical protein